MALERTSLLETEGRRARDELRLKRAAAAVSASLDPGEVYTRVVEHAAAITGGTHALLTRLNARAGELRTAAQVDFSGRAGRAARVAGQQQLRRGGAHQEADAAHAAPTPRRSDV